MSMLLGTRRKVTIVSIGRSEDLRDQSKKSHYLNWIKESTDSIMPRKKKATDMCSGPNNGN